MSNLAGARIVLGVTGGVAAYKSADLVSKLVQAGATVDTLLTEAGSRFVGPATFEALTGRPVHTSVFAPWREDWHGHISLGRQANAIVVAPATADAIARLAHGLADDMLGNVALATTAPLLLAPAMEHAMFHHPATQANLALLRDRGAVQIGPEPGRHASGDAGDGRMSAPATIMSALRAVLGRNGPLAAKRVVITAGGTREALDPVRFLGNRSSGQMGIALADAAIDAGAVVTLITTLPPDTPPWNAHVVLVDSALEMQRAVADATRTADVLIMAAAVADFRPAEARTSKIKKRPGEERLTIELVRNPDIVGSIDRPDLLKVGFAAETDDLLANAQQKLAAKSLAMIVANDAVATIGSPDSTAHLIVPGEPVRSLPPMSKEALANVIVASVASLLSGTHG